MSSRLRRPFVSAHGPFPRVSARLLSRFRFWSGFCAAILASHALVAAAADEKPLASPHHFQLTCAVCHENAGAATETSSPTPGRLIRSINDSCTLSGCHQQDASLTHPVGIRPRGKLPADLPLDQSGHLTCLTCHDEIKGYALSGASPNYLRRVTNSELCAACHVARATGSRSSTHWQFSDRAHLGPARKQTAGMRLADIGGAIDEESRSCLSCHDDILAMVTAEHDFGGQKSSRLDNMSDHPIGVRYDRIAVRKARDFRAPAVMNSRIRLFDGRVGCGSCHSLYSSTRNHLVDRAERGALCRQCHNK